MIERFLESIEKEWTPTGAEPISLKILGSTALFLLTDYARGTKDADVFEVTTVEPDIWKRLKTIAGKDTALAKTHRLYVDLVAPGLPFLPSKPLFHAVAGLEDRLKHFRVEAMDPTDVVVSKLKTFRAGDIDDIRAMVNRDRIKPAHLIERFELAKEQWLSHSRVDELPNYIENLHVIQCDYLFVPETPIELPGWLLERLS